MKRKKSPNLQYVDDALDSLNKMRFGMRANAPGFISYLRGTTELNVGTFNCRAKGEESLKNGLTVRTLATIVAQADMMCVQEILDKDVPRYITEDISDRFGLDYDYAYKSAGDKREFHVTFFLKNRISVMDEAIYPYQLPGSRRPMLFIANIPNKVSILGLNWHLPAPDDRPEASIACLPDIFEWAREQYKNFFPDKNYNFMLFGDWNHNQLPNILNRYVHGRMRRIPHDPIDTTVGYRTKSFYDKIFIMEKFATIDYKHSGLLEIPMHAEIDAELLKAKIMLSDKSHMLLEEAYLGHDFDHYPVVARIYHKHNAERYNY